MIRGPITLCLLAMFAWSCAGSTPDTIDPPGPRTDPTGPTVQADTPDPPYTPQPFTGPTTQQARGSGWHCFESRAQRSDTNYASFCHRTRPECESDRADSARTYHVTPCRSRKRAACFLYTDRATDERWAACSDSIRQCLLQRAIQAGNPDKYEFVTECEFIE